jgi:hypothetical protein
MPLKVVGITESVLLRWFSVVDAEIFYRLINVFVDSFVLVFVVESGNKTATFVISFAWIFSMLSFDLLQLV